MTDICQRCGRPFDRYDFGHVIRVGHDTCWNVQRDSWGQIIHSDYSPYWPAPVRFGLGVIILAAAIWWVLSISCTVSGAAVSVATFTPSPSPAPSLTEALTPSKAAPSPTAIRVPVSGLAPSETPWVCVAQGSVNIRSGPGVGYKVLDTVVDKSVIVLGQVDQWYQVAGGYVSAGWCK